ncbi:MAG: hypothetical protein ABI811_11000 [Acidobacteriota bacterium]
MNFHRAVCILWLTISAASARGYFVATTGPGTSGVRDHECFNP